VLNTKLLYRINGDNLELSEKRIHNFLFAVQGMGIVFVAIFLVAYLGGLPTTNVLHNEPVFRIPLAVLGVVFLVIALATVVLAIFSRKRTLT
jgi:hypothetical protein